jgi:acetylornithine deacetylase
MGERPANAAEQTLARLVAWDTVSHRPLDAMAGWLAGRAEDVGMRVERFESAPGKVNVVASAGPPVAGGLGLSGHMDVVPVEGQAWSTDPFRLTIRGDRLLGRGTCDMKGFIAASVEAIAGLDLQKLQRELVLVWTHDEEVGCQGSASLVSELSRSGRRLPEAMLVGEPTSFRIAHLHPGHATVRIRCTGRPAHSSRPSLGLSAIKLAGRVLAVLHEFEQALAGIRSHEDSLDTPYTVMNVGRIQGGEAINIVPERCVLDVGFRPLPGVAFAQIRADLFERLAPVVSDARLHGGDIAVEDVQCSEGLHTPAHCEHIDLLRPHAAAGGLVGVPFATDAGNLAALGCRSLVFGPGSIDVAHRPDEFLMRKDLARTVDIVQDLIYRRCIAA